MARPWMPLHIGDYLRDTAHLRATDSGAYLHLIMHYWERGGLPNDEKQLATIAKLSMAEWRKHKPTLQAFFSDSWKHKRIDREIAAAEEKYERRAVAGRRGGSESGKLRRSNAEAMLNHAHATPMLHQSDLEEERKDSTSQEASGPERTPEQELFKRGKNVLGHMAGGLIARLLKAKQGSVPLARAAIEQAATKENPREYIGRIVSGGSNGKTNHQSGKDKFAATVERWKQGILDDVGEGGGGEAGRALPNGRTTRS